MLDAMRLKNDEGRTYYRLRKYNLVGGDIEHGLFNEDEFVKMAHRVVAENAQLREPPDKSETTAQ